MSEVHGPIDTLVIEFPAGTDGSATGAAIADLVESGIVRLYDLMVVTAEADGSCTAVEMEALPDDLLGALRAFSGARSQLFGPDDVAALAGVLEPGASAVVLLYENAWAIPFVRAAFSEGGQVVASTRLRSQDIQELLDAVEA